MLMFLPLLPVNSLIVKHIWRNFSDERLSPAKARCDDPHAKTLLDVFKLSRTFRRRHDFEAIGEQSTFTD